MAIQAVGDYVIFKIIETTVENNTALIKAEVVSISPNITEIRDKDIINIIYEGHDYLPDGLCITSFNYVIGKEK